ncbi:twinkle protein, mitochondrial [Galendromus occidentalis]|uniref:Twinkle protein, mitochondrial n=1 Tax=Galendromus occidentalis TaxID=34638 RepID=A0AAJ6QVE5_9ACAR|nr:twinkle protein, mitochondrial [Galendromus occidentalis]
MPKSVHAIKVLLNRAKIPFQVGSTCLRVRCPNCSSGSDDKRGYLNSTSGTFFCPDCELVADWGEFKRALESDYRVEPNAELQTAAFPTAGELEEVQRRLSSAVEMASVRTKDIDQVLSTLDLGRIKGSFLKLSKYRISYDDSGDPKLVLPVLDIRKRLIALTYVGGGGDVETFPRSGMAGCFSTEDTVTADNRVVLVPHPADAILVTQQTRMTSIAVESTAQLPVTRLPLFEKFGKIVIWFNATNEHWQDALLYARKLGNDRTSFLRQVPQFSRPLTTEKISAALSTEKPMAHKSVIVFDDLREAVRDTLMKWESACGVKWTRFPALNKYLKGHRRGELTIFTGQTGSGKTTFLSELSLDLMMQGVPTLWGSFEINNVRLLRCLMTQFALVPLTENMARFDEIADEFQKLPLFMLKFHGQESINNVVEAMMHAVYVHDIQHVILDNLQFMMGVAVERFQLQDTIVSTLRRFATEYNVHITLVVHPRKEKDDDPLCTASIFGTGKVSQEADNVLILQTSARGSKFVQVKKNRFDGDLGAFPLHFDKQSLSYWKNLPRPVDNGAKARWQNGRKPQRS